ncbi:hypothetical protein M0811_12482 [Anaeramoeba ignava]|uniref:Spatacsin C-terminal domain-containing protein n=1 Tax=Anaeramoeba ignava TaxID=1746090 RepID=A0A9Q0LBJ9_ANAIG|nr:hypothetical protein M0811_12482 [Anaeramoeba ignava]
MFQLEKNPKIEKINQDSQQFNSEQDEPSKPKSIDEIVTELTQELVDSNISSSISIISSNPSFLQNNIFLNLKEDYQLKMTAKDLNLEISLFSFLKIFASKIAYIFFRHGDSKTALKILGGFGSTHKTKFLNTILSNTVIKKIRNQILLLQNDQQIQEIKTPLELIKSIENLQNSLIHVTDDYSKVYSSQLRKVKNTLRESLQFEKFSNAISQTIITQKDVFEFWKDFDPLIQEEEYYAGDIFPRNLNEKSLFPHIDRIIFPKKSTEKIESKTNKFSRLYFAAKPLWIKHCLSPRNRFKIFLDIKQNFSKQFGDQIFPIEDESKNYNDFVYEKLFYHLSHSQFEPILELLKNIISKQDHWGIVMEILPKLFAYMKQWRQYQVLSTIIQESRNQKMDQKKIFYFDRFDRKIQILCYSFSLFESKNNFLLFSSDLIKEFGEVCSENSLVNILIHLSKRNPEAFYETCKKIPKELTQKNAWILRLSKFGIDLNESQMKNEEYQNKITELIFVDSKGYLQKNIGVNEINTSIISTRMNILVRIGIAAHLPGLFSENFRNALKEFEKKQFYENFIKFSTFFNPDQFFQKLNPKYSSEIKCTEFVSPRSDWNLLGFLGKSYSPELFTLISQKNTYFAINFEQKNALPNFLLGNIPILLINGRSIRAFLSTSKISISKQIFERVFEQNIQWIINSIFYAGILSFTNKRISSTCVSYLEILGTYSTQLNIVISALNFIYKWRCSTQNTSPEEIRENLICEFTQIQYPFEISVEKIANKIEDILFSNIVVHYQKTENYNQDFFEMIGQFSAAFSREKLKDEILKQFIKKGDVIGFLRFAWKMKVDESHLFKLIESSDFQSAEHKQAFQNVSQHIFYRVYRAQNCEKDGEFFNKENQNKKKFRNYISNILAYSQKRCSAKTLMSYSMETRQPFYCVVVDILKGSKAISCMIGYFLSVVGLDFLDDLESKKKIFNRFLETPQEKLVEEIGEYLDSEEFTEEQFANVVIYLSSEFPFQLYRALVIFDSYNPLKNILKALHHFYRHQFAKMRQEINNFDINFEEMENNKQKEAKQRIFANNPDWIKQISINMIQKAVSKFSVPSTNPKILLESASKSRVFSSFFAKFFRMHEILQKFSFGNFIAVKMNEEPQFQDIFGDPYEIIRKLISMRQFRLAREFASEAGISTASVVLQEALSLMSSNKRLGRSGEKVRLKKRVLWDKCEKLFHKKKCSKKVVVEFYFSEIEKWTRSVGLNAQEYQFLVERGISRVQELNMKHNGKYRDYFDHLSSQVKIISLLQRRLGIGLYQIVFFLIENSNENSKENSKENLNENSKENLKENLNENSNENLKENSNGNLNENVNVNLNCHEIYCAYKKAFNKRAEKFKQAKNLLDSSQYSTRHQEILDLIISELLSKNNVKQAESLCQQFGYQNQEFRLIRACYQIASSEEMDSERTISNEMNSLVDILSSRKAEIPHLRSKKKAIRYLTRMVRSCKSYCQLILVTYQISKLLSISFSEVESSPYKTFRLLVNCENEDSLTFVQIFHDFYKLNDRTVAEILAEIFFNRAFSHINDPDLDETFKIRFTAFLKRFEKFVAISRNPEIIATKLLDLLKEKYAQKTKMLFNTDGEVRVLIQAHKCFRVSYSFNEIGKVEHFIQSKILVYRSKQKYDQLSLLLLNLTNPVHLEQIFDILVDDKELGSIPGQITSGETRPEVLNVLSRSLKKESKKHEEKSILSVLFHLKMHRNLGEFLLSHVRDDLSQFEPHKKRKSFDEVYRRLQEIGETCYNAAEEFEKAGCHQKMVVCFSLCSIASLQGRNLWLNLINAKIEPILINPNKSPNKDTPKSANAKKNLRPKQGAYSTRSNVNDRVNVNLNINANVNPNLTPIKKSNWNPDLQLLEIMSQKLYNFFDALIFAEYFGLGTQQAWVKSIFHQVILRQNFGYFMNYLQVFLIPNSLVAELVKTFKLQVRHKKMDARWKEGFLFVFNFIEDRAFQYQVAKELGFIDLMKKIEDSFPEIKV